MKFTVLGQGTAVPPNFLSREDAVELVKENFCRTDRERRIVLEHCLGFRQRDGEGIAIWSDGYVGSRLGPEAPRGEGQCTARRYRLLSGKMKLVRQVRCIW